MRAAGVAVALAAGGIVVYAPAASAGTCIEWSDDLPWINDDTGATGWTSQCVAEIGGVGVGLGGADGGGASGAGGSGGGGSGAGSGSDSTMAALVSLAPPAGLDEFCVTRVPSSIDRNLATGSSMPIGFPAGPSMSAPTLVTVTLDPSLSTRAFAGVDWYREVSIALAQWQYQLEAAGVAIRFQIDQTPRSLDEAKDAMWDAVTAGRLEYHWHIRGMYDGEKPPGPDPTGAGTRQDYPDPSGRSLFQETALFEPPPGSLTWSSPTVGRTDRVALLAHEAGHTLGEADIGPSWTSVMSGIATTGAVQATCSDGKSVLQATRQNPRTGAITSAGGL